jgi:type IV secretory pathway TrbL component
MAEMLPDLILAGLLLLTTFWCGLLYRRLHRLRVDRGDIEEFVAAISAATQRAEAAIAGIRETASVLQQALGSQQEAARQQEAELARLADGSARLARRLETAIHQGARTMAELGLARERDSGSTSPLSTARQMPTGPAASGAAARHDMPRADPELLKALEALR